MRSLLRCTLPATAIHPPPLLATVTVTSPSSCHCNSPPLSSSPQRMCCAGAGAGGQDLPEPHHHRSKGQGRGARDRSAAYPGCQRMHRTGCAASLTAAARPCFAAHHPTCCSLSEPPKRSHHFPPHSRPPAGALHTSPCYLFAEYSAPLIQNSIAGTQTPQLTTCWCGATPRKIAPGCSPTRQSSQTTSTHWTTPVGDTWGRWEDSPCGSG